MGLVYGLLIKTVTHRLVYRPGLLRHFLSRVPLSQITLACVKWHKTVSTPGDQVGGDVGGLGQLQNYANSMVVSFVVCKNGSFRVHPTKRRTKTPLRAKMSRSSPDWTKEGEEQMSHSPRVISLGFNTSVHLKFKMEASPFVTCGPKVCK